MNRPHIERAGDGALCVTGELTFATVTGLNGEAASLFSTSTSNLVVDLAGVSRADSAGLALLIEWLRRARQSGVSLTFRGMPVQMRTMAAASDLEALLPLTG